MFNPLLRKITLSLTLMLFLSLPLLGAHAETPSKNENPAQQINIKMADLIGKLDENSMQHFMTMYTNYNIIETVKIVRDDVGTAIKACGKNNPAMKKELRARFTDWKKEINPIIKDANGNYKNMMIAQDYAKDSELKEIFDFIDTARTETSRQFKKIPVTSKEACTYLLNKMDETQPGMKKLLESTLTPIESSIPTSEEAPQSTPKDL